MSDLAALFPNLPADIIREFESSGGAGDGPLALGGETSAVTDEAIEAYLRQSGSLRAPLKPVLEGQQVPATPQFVNNGRIAPPANNATVEPPDYGTAPPESVPQDPASVPPAEPDPAPSPQQAPEEPAPDAIPPSPSPTQPQWPSPQTIEEIPPPTDSPTASRQQGIEALAGLFESDPQLRSLVASYLTTGRVPQQQAVQPPPVAAPTALPSAPQIEFDEFADPALKAVFQQNQLLNERLNAIEQVRTQEHEQAQRQYLQNASTIVESVASDFATRYKIPANVMADIRGVASRLGVANTYMAGVHPTSGLPVVPDVAEAAREAFRIAYSASPMAQQLESERIIARAKQDADRRQKLAGVGGSSASVPRQPPTPQTPEGRKDAMNREVAEMFNGTWTGAN